MASEFHIIATDKGFALVGDLKFSNAQAALRTYSSLKKPVGLSEVEFDLSGLETSDSAGLALLLLWRRAWIESGAKVKMSGAHHALSQLIEISGLSPIFAAQ
jgi:anti-anti-sigma factor